MGGFGLGWAQNGPGGARPAVLDPENALLRSAWPQASTSKGAASSKRKSTPQCHTQQAASALNIKAARPKEDLESITPRGRYIGPIRQPPEETTYI